MSEESRLPPSLLKEVLRLVISVDSFLEDGPFNPERAMELRQQVYDLLKRLENRPWTPRNEALFQIAARAFTLLQTRLTCPQT